MSPLFRLSPSDIPAGRKRPTRLEYPIEAFRAWDLGLARAAVSHSPDSTNTPIGPRATGPDGFCLLSVARPVLWEGPVLRAHRKPLDEAGNLCRRSGIYSLKSPQYVRKCIVPAYDAPVWGSLDIWGQVIEHELGYRSEYAMVTRLTILARPVSKRLGRDFDIQGLAGSFCRRYECDVRVSWKKLTLARRCLGYAWRYFL